MRLLFIRFSSIGDIVLTSSAVRCAKKQIPGVEIHFLTKESMKDLVTNNPFIDHCHFLGNDMQDTIEALKNILQSKSDIISSYTVHLTEINKHGIQITAEYFTAHIPLESFNQLKEALGFAVKEAMEKTVIVRRTDTHAQEIVPLDQLSKHMKKIETQYWK